MTSQRDRNLAAVEEARRVLAEARAGLRLAELDRDTDALELEFEAPDTAGPGRRDLD